MALQVCFVIVSPSNFLPLFPAAVWGPVGLSQLLARPGAHPQGAAGAALDLFFLLLAFPPP